MIKTILLFTASSTLLALTSCNNTPSTTAAMEKKDSVPAFDISAVRSAIVESNKSFVEVFQKGDSATVLAHYTTDACLNPPNMPRQCGTTALVGFFKTPMGIKDIKLTTEEVLGGPEAVSEIGTFELTDDKGKSMDKGKYVVVWKPENGKWKIYRDIFNSDLPPMAMTPAAKKK